MTNQIHTQAVLTFDGIDDYIDFGRNDIGGVFAEGSSAFTVSGWINPHELTNKATSYGTRNVFFARSSERYSDNFEFGISETGSLDVFIDETVSKGIKTFGNGELVIGEWHFFAIVFNSGQITVYLDNNEYKDSLRGSSLNKATSSVTLGATVHKQVYFKGQLANISVWNYPCTQEQIHNHRCGLIAGDEEGLVAYWKLDDGQGTSVENQTGNSFKGNFRGNPTWDLAQIPFATNQSESFIETVIQLETEDEQAQINSEESDNIPNQIPLVTQVEELTTNLLAATVSLVKNDEDKPKEIPPAQIADTVNIQESPVTTMNTEAQPKYKILSIDGGGIRSIIPAFLLAEIERRTQKPIFSLFDLIAGTSSGGILALGLTKPQLNSQESDKLPIAEYKAEDLLQLFLEYGVEIFYEPFFERLIGPIEDIFLQPKYPSDSKQEIFRKYFGSASLENNLKEVFVTSYDIGQRVPVLLTNNLEKQEIKSKSFRQLCADVSLLDAALATSATPTYFSPHQIVNSENSGIVYTLIDGGVFANNPAHLAILEAQITSKAKTKKVLNTEDILIVSLGTGSLTSAYPYKEVKNWGLLQWGRPLLNIVFDGSSEVVAGELERLFKSSDEESKSFYYRFQTFLDGELEKIDNIKLQNTRQLQAIAHRMIAEKSQQIDELCSLLLG
ncbi:MULTISPECIES: patatin-like phospholipase family protein [Calothrix]|uniref:Patatin-like phospholipase family protein n=2 Tax=Calothrix TaxID=1186 RepID=A0ABR8A6G7_9CYAN|nr:MULTISPECIES: patatin-like phospholipase family protein [Calothrix]MBD2194873.1 patatin-like phospholipase family protein [Calothrix parietina FACHB-288]MBD2223471.1 patatin-like phospholipase family protein [Calothrix anomala FACHB-343]